MPKISPTTVSAFLERFYQCADGVVREVQVDFVTKSATVTLSCQDREREIRQPWINLVFDVQEVVELRLIEGESTCVVLSQGLHVGFFDGLIYLDFCPYTAAPAGVEDFKRSHFLVVGERCTWALEPAQ